MDFLKPVLELRNTEANWEEEEEEGEEEAAHAPSVDDDGVSFACTNQEDSSMELQGELIEVHESSAQERDNEDTDVSTPSSRRQRQASASHRKKSSRVAEQVEDQDQTNKLLNIVSGITEQIDAQRCPHTMFAISLVPLLKELLPDHYFNMKIAVQHCIHSFTVPRHVSVPMHEIPSPQIFTPISSASNTAPNPYPSSFAEPSSIYETPRSRIPYPIPSPVASVISPPSRTRDIGRQMDMRPLDSTSYHVPTQNRPVQLYEQIPSVANQFPPVTRPMEQQKPTIQSHYPYHNRSLEVASNMPAPYRQYGSPSVPPDNEISPPVLLRKYPSTQGEALQLTPPSSSTTTLQRHTKPDEHSSPSFLNL
ncbi:hypothetical protein AB205_0180160 [Aquarana catesbeiana]|uniref:BESS domain-containing protein n=1 Tax=Aquarana catesbeiana TaxID=8400 RepID=A0A2G9Q9A5_AQUCT|nr:hypothetical protein AB205_0180160 [Aquarana catesbeiana]